MNIRTYLIALSLLLFSKVSAQISNRVQDTKAQNDMFISDLINNHLRAVKSQAKQSSYLSNQYSISYKDGKYGIYNKTKKEYFAEIKYDSITRSANYLINNIRGNFLFKSPVIELNSSNEDILVFKENGKYGLKKINGETLLDAKCDEINKMGYAYRFKVKDKWGFSGIKKIVPAQYDYIIIKEPYQYNDDRKILITTYKNLSITVYTSDGEQYVAKPTVLISHPLQVKEKIYKPFSSSMYRNPPKGLLFFKDGKYGVDNWDGKEIISPVYDSIFAVDDTNFILRSNERYGMADSLGKIVLPLHYMEIKALRSGVFTVKDSLGKFGILNSNGTTLYPFTIASIDNFRGYGSSYVILSEGFERQRLLLYDKSKFYTVLDNCKMIKYSTYNYEEKQLIFQSATTGLYGFYNIEKQNAIAPVYKEVQNGPGNTYLGKKDSLFEDIIAKDLSITPLQLKVIGYRNGYYILPHKKGMMIGDEKFNFGTFNYPKLEHFYAFDPRKYVDDPTKRYYSTLFKYYTSGRKKNYGIIDEKGNIIIPANRYDDITIAHQSDTLNPNAQTSLAGLFLNNIFVCRKYLKGDKDDITLYFKGKRVAQFVTNKSWKLQYENIRGEHLIVKNGDNTKIFDLFDKKMILDVKKGKFIISRYFGYGNVIPVSGKESRVVYYSRKGNIIADRVVANNAIKPEIFDDRDFIASKKGKYGLVDVYTEFQYFPYEFDTIYPFIKYGYIGKKQGKYGMFFKNEGGKDVTMPFVYDKLEPINATTAIVKKNGKFGLVERDSVLIELKYDTYISTIGIILDELKIYTQSMIKIISFCFPLNVMN